MSKLINTWLISSQFNKNAKSIYDESSLMINNGTTCFLFFLNVGNNNIVVLNN